MRNCCILQMEAVHEEVLPSFIHLLNKKGYKPSVFLNQKSADRKGSIFNYCKKIDYNLEFITLGQKGSWQELRKKIVSDDRNFEFLVCTTYQNDATSKFYAQFEMPVIGIIHNANKFLNQEFSLEQVKSGKTFAMCLAKHVAIFIRNKIDINLGNIGYYEPYLMEDNAFFNTKKRNIPLKDTIYIGITGSVVLRDRDYTKLATLLKDSSQDDFKRKIKFVICGGGKNRAEFQEFVTVNKVEEFFDFAPLDPESGYVPYEDYMEYLMKCHFLISLFTSKSNYYFNIKISSVITSALAYNIPMLFDDRPSLVYGNPFKYYEMDNIVNSLQELNEMSEDEYNELLTKCNNYREFVVENSLNQVSRSLKHIEKSN